MIEVTQEMRDDMYRKEGIIPYPKDTIKKVIHIEYERTNIDNISATCQKK